ncbi:unnamed protein product [Oncorhynchus mykiss]|uniref:Uncharacterized protein n=1 Tax=Oncorhynchus mykiss TaxID=8022 RepID=A0A060Z322_ONCMY|nr:unnamed protein product [Oncorhynchus mykiss]
MSTSRSTLAVVDEHSTCRFNDIHTKEQLFKAAATSTSRPVTSQCTNRSCRALWWATMAPRSSACMSTPYPPWRLPSNSYVPVSMYQCLCTSVYVPERRMFKQVYQISCLCVTDSDCRDLATDALEGFDCHL